MVIQGKLALITGASSGIGEATAREIAGKGGRVILVARSASRLQQIATDISAAGGLADYYPVDLAMPDAVGELAAKIFRDIGIPDILVNNAGAGRWLTIEETGARELEQMMALPYFAAFNLTRELLPHMRRRGSGHIVNITSVAGRLIWPGAAGYAAARAAMATFSKSLETETHGSGIHVTLGVFSKVASTFWEHNPGSEERLPKVNAYLPTLTPQQVAHAVAVAIERESSLVVLPRVFKFIFLLNTLLPKTTSRMLRLGWTNSS
ncbi:MAG: SDR family NAD(P)-dependent oxidoreductase [Syntrophobacteraceae bacterium]|jgi:short-subunit dehydrogenase